MASIGETIQSPLRIERCLQRAPPVVCLELSVLLMSLMDHICISFQPFLFLFVLHVPLLKDFSPYPSYPPLEALVHWGTQHQHKPSFQLTRTMFQ
jgi:hypothetical protein